MSNGLQRGYNNGLTGLADFPGVDGLNVTHAPAFSCDVKLYSLTQEVGLLLLLGRGVGAYGVRKLVTVGGGMVVRGEMSPEAPGPETFRGQTGTITIQYHSVEVPGATPEDPPTQQPLTITCPVRVQAAVRGHVEGKDSFWTLTLTCVITADPTWSEGWQGITPASQEGVGQIETYEGSGRVLDPDALQDSLTRRIVLWPVEDTEAADLTAALALIGEQVAPEGLKYRACTIARVCYDAAAFTLTYARTTAAEDIENAGTFLTADPDGLTNAGQVTRINAELVAQDGLVIRRVTTKELNDGAIQKTAETGLETTEQELERTNSSETTDPKQINPLQFVAIRSVSEPAVPPVIPAGAIFTGWKKQEQADGTVLWTAVLGPRDSEQEQTFKSKWLLDVSTIDSDGTLIAVQATTDPATPAPAAPFANGVNVGFQVLERLSQTRYAVAYTYAYETTLQKLAREVSSIEVDPQTLDDITVIGRMDSADPPATPAGLKLVTKKRHDFPNNHYRWIWTFGLVDSKDRIEFDSTIAIDSSTLDSEAVLIRVQSSVTPAAPDPPFTGGKLVRYAVKQRTGARWVLHYTYGYETNAERLEREHTRDHLGDWSANASTAKLDGAAPSHASLVKVAEETIPQPNGHALTVAKHALETDPDKWIRTNTQTTVDPDGWDDRAKVAAIGVEPAAPGGLVKTAVTTQTLPDGTTGHIVEAAVEGNDAKWIREHTSTTTDPKALETAGKAAAIGEAPTPAAGHKIVKTTAVQLPDGSTGNIAETGLADTEESLRSQNAEVEISQAAYRREDQPTVVDCTLADLATHAASVFAANQSNIAFDGLALRGILTNPGKALLIKRFREDDKIAEYRPDPGSGSFERRRCTVSAGFKLRVGEYEAIGDGTWKRCYIRACRTVRVRGTLVIRRRVVAANQAAARAAFLNVSAGTVNSVALLGFPAYTLLYNGCSAKGSEYIAGNHVYDVDGYFDYDWLGHYDDSEVPEDEWVVTDAVAVTGRGWYAPSVFGYSVAYHPAASFAGVWS